MLLPVHEYYFPWAHPTCPNTTGKTQLEHFGLEMLIIMIVHMPRLTPDFSYLCSSPMLFLVLNVPHSILNTTMLQAGEKSAPWRPVHTAVAHCRCTSLLFNSVAHFRCSLPLHTFVVHFRCALLLASSPSPCDAQARLNDVIIVGVFLAISHIRPRLNDVNIVGILLAKSHIRPRLNDAIIVGTFLSISHARPRLGR